MNILQVHNYYKIPGGEDQVVRNEGRLLREHGHQVYLYSRYNEELVHMNGWERLCLPFSTIFSVRTFREIRKVILQKRIDIVHVHNTLPLISPAVFYAAWSLHVPVVMTVHNFRLLCPGGTFYREGSVCEDCVKKGMWCSVRHGCYRNSRLQTLACAAGISIHRLLGTYRRLNYICLTKFNAEKLLQYSKICPQKVFVKPNYMENTGEIIEADKRKNELIYAGRLEKDKGIEVLLKAYKILETQPSAPRLVICGEGSLKKKCETYIQKNHLTKVSMAGGMPHEIVKKMMAQAKGIVLPSLWYEGFPMVIAEGYCVRTPVIASDLGNMENLIEENVNGWKFEVGNAAELAEKIRQCNPALCSFEVSGQSEWSKEGNYRKLMQIYESCSRNKVKKF